MSSPPRWFLLVWVSLACTSLTVAQGCGGASSGSPGPPNLILIVTDDQRWDSVADMPEVLDRLARRGTTYANSFATTPLCAPSRASILTGRYASDLGVLGLGGPDGGARAFHEKGAVDSTLPVWLQQQGYATALVGKYLNQYGAISPEVPVGWDTWHGFVDDSQLYYDYVLNENGIEVPYGDGPEVYSTDVLRDRALAFIDRHAGEPFFLYFAPFAPHYDATAAPRHQGAFEGVEWPRRASYREDDLSDKPEVIRIVRSIQEQLDGDDVERATTATIAAQAESMLAVDEAVAAIDDRLEALGIADDTVIVFTSDNGVAWGEHWLPGKDFAYEETLRIPLVIRAGRGGAAPVVDERLALTIDLAPTLAGLAGARVPEEVAGRSLFETSPWRSDFLAEYFGLWIVPAWTAVRTLTWKYVQYATGERELYDLVNDPFELDNLLAAVPPPALLQQADVLAQRLAELSARPPPP